MLTQEQRTAVYERVEQFIDMGNAHFGTDCNVPHTRFDKRGTCGGTANYSKMELNFNAGLMVDNWDEYMNQIIPHEVAHIIKTHIYGYGKGVNSAHGLHWKRVMRALGVEPDRTHNMDVSKVKQHKSPLKKYIYVCTCGCEKEVVLSAVRHNRMVRGTHGYSLHGRNKLVLKESLGSMTYKEAHDRKTPGFIKEAAANKKPAKKAKKPTEPKAGTIGARALKIFRDMEGSTRQEVIGVIATAMNVTGTRAGQLYQGAKRKAQELA